MNLTVDTLQSVLRRIVPEPIGVQVFHPLVRDEVEATLVVTTYSRRALINGLEMVKLTTPEGFANLIEPRIREMLVTLAEELEAAAKVAREAAGE